MPSLANNRAPAEVDVVGAVAGRQATAFEGGGTPVALAGEGDFLAGVATPTFDLGDALATQAQRSGMDAGGFPWVLRVVLLALQPALQVAGGDAADRHRGGEFGFAEAFWLVLEFQLQPGAGRHLDASEARGALEHGAVRGFLACTFALVLPETDLQPGAQSQRDQQEQHQQAAARPAAAQALARARAEGQ